MAESADLKLSETAVRDLRDIVPEVAGRTVSAITDDVPSYAAAFSGPMGQTIRTAVELALGGFISLAARSGGGTAQAPTAQAVDGAYQLGRGEARSGRTVDALLSAYRIGARVSWREMSATVVRNGVDAGTLAHFAELVFAYIDELSAASVAGHNDELATTGRVRERLLERLADHLLDGSSDEDVAAAAERAGWALPETLTAVLVPESQVRAVRGGVAGEPLQPGADLDGMVALLVPDAHGRRRAGLLRALAGRDAVAGPPRPWSEVRASFDRAQRMRALGLGPDSEEHLAALVLTADPSALADLQARALAPLAELRPSTAEKLVETLRSWLLNQGKREAVAEDLFVHAQTVRYRMGQLREAFGDSLDDPQRILELTLALALPPEVPEPAATPEVPQTTPANPAATKAQSKE